MKRPRAGQFGIVLLLVSGALAGCGAPSGGSRAIDGDDVPYALLSPSPTPTETAIETSPPEDETTADVFFVAPDDRLIPVLISVGTGRTDDLVTATLAALQAGPDEDARAAGLSTTLGPDIELRLTKIVGTTVYVDIALASRQPAADQIPLAIGQIVLSATSLVAVTHVVLLVDGEEVDVPLPGGQRIAGPVTAADYEILTASSPLP